MHKLTLLSLLLASSAHAQYLIDPAGGTNLATTPGRPGQLYANRPLGFTGHFFGVPQTTVDVVSEGFLNFDDALLDETRHPAFPYAPHAAIAPLWTALSIEPGDSVIEKVQPGVYYSVTWDVSDYYVQSYNQRFQVVWFGAETTINGFKFLPDDIAFSYAGFVPANITWHATVGLNADRDGSSICPVLPQYGGFILASEATGLLPIFADSGSFIVFRPAGDSYVPLIIPGTPAPQPTCAVDFNHDGFVDFFDYDDFVQAFERGC